ncbi:glyoxalase [Actinoplanes sp. OR16]|uniref:VOC family protein n=1 Tax=Actinoplanes sp. OR16 TaxID=946334 RepID=UPI000F6EB409|nr:VOC family protein [Actinoplanes sp. OR16]BBH69587.1 glyoxalase [Actinoplanes sp. OR16]
MTIRHITIDARDTLAIARFWSELTGAPIDAESDDEEALVESTPGLLFIAVPEAKTVKNRLHLDIQPPTGTRDEFVDKVVALGATIFQDHRKPDGTGWVTLRDPEGNEFCVERSAAEREPAAG